MLKSVAFVLSSFWALTVAAGVLVTTDKKGAVGELKEEGNSLFLVVRKGNIQGKIKYSKDRVLWYELGNETDSFFKGARLAYKQNHRDAATILAELSVKEEPRYADKAKAFQEWMAQLTPEEKRDSAPNLAAAAPPPQAADMELKSTGIDPKDNLIYNLVKRDLEIQEGKRLGRYDDKKLANVPVFGIYFSASWCPACRAFTPKLIETYTELKKKYGDSFEIIFVSGEDEKDSFEEYVLKNKMPWPVLKLSEVRKTKLNDYAMRFIPYVAIVDHTGKRLIESEKDPLGCLEKILKERAAPVAVKL